MGGDEIIDEKDSGIKCAMEKMMNVNTNIQILIGIKRRQKRVKLLIYYK